MRRLFFLLPLVVGLVACSDKGDDVAGGPGSITTNGIALVDGRAASYATVALRKVDFKAEEPVEKNALVEADIYADENGMFNLDIPAEGKYRLTVVHDGVAYSRIVKHGDFAEVGEATRPDTVKLDPTAVMAGVVDIPEGSSAVWVGVVGMDVLVKTDERGWFALPSLPANDSLKLYFMNEGFDQNLGEESVYMIPRESAMKDYRIEKVNPDTTSRDSLPKIVALLDDGTPAAYATIALRAADAMVDDYVVRNSMVESDLRADGQGRFDLDWPDKGNFRLTVTTDGYAFSKVFAAKDLSKIDTLRLDATASISSKVTLRSSFEYLWVGVYGLDLLVKTNDLGAYVLPNVPANDSLEIYFVMADSTKALYKEWNAVGEPYSTEFLSPVMVLQDFEGDVNGWYLNSDSLKKGTVISASSVKDGIEYDSDRKSKVFHSEYKLADDDYAWVLVGSSFDHYMNFSAIDSVVFYAKGDGNIRLSLENYIDPTKNLKAATEWISLSSEWQRISVNPAELCVGSATDESCFTTWSTIKDYVKQFHIFVQDGTEFYIDDVTLYGALF